MNSEQRERAEVSPEERGALFHREIAQALSPAWPKSIQELLPGYLPDLPFGELTPDVQTDYRKAYAILGEMVEQKEADVVFHSDHTETDTGAQESVARPRFLLHVDHGKHSFEDDALPAGEMLLDHA